MVTFLSAALTYLRAFLVSRHNLGLEVAALRQQVTVYKRKQPRPKLHRFDRLFWMALRRLWTNWADALVLVKPDKDEIACSPQGVASADTGRLIGAQTDEFWQLLRKRGLPLERLRSLQTFRDFR
jgi:hypothetical protein